jgi:hypothetical protein
MGYKEKNEKQWARKHNTESNRLINTNPREKSSALETVRVITVFTVFRLLTDFVCLYTDEF